MPSHSSEVHSGEVLSVKRSVEGEVQVAISDLGITVSAPPCLNVQFKWETGQLQVIDLNLYKCTFNSKTVLQKLYNLWPHSFTSLPINFKDIITQLVCCNNENLKLPNEVMDLVIRNILLYHISLATDDNKATD